MIYQNNPIVVITGGSKGIGKALALHWFAKGARLIICSRKLAEVEKACLEIDPEQKRCFGIAADVSLPTDCEKVISFAVKTYGGIDLLINNAGIYGDIGLLEEANLENWAQTIQINVLGTVFCTRYAIPVMKAAGHGKIINFAGAGVGGKKPLPHFSAYYTSKIAVAGFTETIAAEISDLNIQINSISPGAINTSFTDTLISEGPQKAGVEAYAKALEQKKAGGDSLEKVCEFTYMLCSPELNHLTGRMLSVKWDSAEILKDPQITNDLFKLRRIDNDLFRSN